MGGGSDPMPSQMAKGRSIQYLETLYANPTNRARTLYYLLNRAAGETFLDVLGRIGDLTVNREVDHLQKHWFGLTTPDQNWWVSLVLKAEAGSPNQVDVNQPPLLCRLPTQHARDGEKIVGAALTTALSASLGFGDRECDDLRLNAPDPLAKPAEFGRWLSITMHGFAGRPLDIFWFCGKGDQFEAMVSWNDHHVNLFLMSPPLNRVAKGVSGAASYASAPRNRPRGIIDFSMRQGSVHEALMNMQDGGVD